MLCSTLENMTDINHRLVCREKASDTKSHFNALLEMMGWLEPLICWFSNSFQSFYLVISSLLLLLSGFFLSLSSLTNWYFSLHLSSSLSLFADPQAFKWKASWTHCTHMDNNNWRITKELIRVLLKVTMDYIINELSVVKRNIVGLLRKPDGAISDEANVNSRTLQPSFRFCIHLHHLHQRCFNLVGLRIFFLNTRGELFD